MATWGYHTLDSDSYDDALYPFIVNVETVARTVNLTPYDDGSGNLTIGAGFNLQTTDVRNAVLDEILYPDGMPSSTVQAADATYRSDLVSAIASEDIALLNSTMLARSTDGAIDYTTKHPSFAFANADQVQDVFDNIQSIYDSDIDTWKSGISDSSERIALFSLAYNQTSGSPLLGTLLHDAIAGSNRAEAWYEIRYDSNGNDSDGVAKRRYFESQEFSLYNPGTLDLTEARQIFQMVTRHDTDGSMTAYDDLLTGYGAQVALANSSYATSAVQTTIAALEPAKEFLVGVYAPGASIDKIWVAYGAIDGSGDDSSTLNYSSGTTNALIIGGNVGCTITGGSGNDWIVGGQGDNTIDGGGGSNTISYAMSPSSVTVDLSASTVTVANGYSGTDSLTNIQNVMGSAHDDILTARSSGQSTIYGSLGNDTINTPSSFDAATTVDYSTLNIDGAASIAVTVAAGVATVDKSTSLGSGEDTVTLNNTTIVGTNGADTFTGFYLYHALTFEGLGGSDTYTFDLNQFNATDAADTTSSGLAAATIVEDASGNFTDIHVSGYTASDNINLDAGPALFALSVNYFRVDPSNSLLFDNFGITFQKPASGPEVQLFSLGTTHYEFGSFYNDIIAGATGAHTIDGGPGTNTLDYSAAPAGVTVDLATGTASNGWGYTDTLTDIQNVIGSSHNDTITGDSHDNVVDGGAGNNTLDGGGGTNTLDYSHDTAGVTVNLSTGTATNGYGGTDTISNFQNVIGSSYNDTITGDSSDNVIDGGAGNNTLNGGSGTNTLDYSHDTAGVTVNLSTGTATNGYGGTDTISNFQNVLGSNHGDTITGNSSDNVITGGAGNDLVINGGGSNTYDGGGGTNTLSYQDDAAGVTVDLSGGTATNGSSGTDAISNFQNIIGSAYDDTITGDSQDNVISGGAGNNTLDGGGGINTLDYSIDPAGVTVDLSAGTATNGWGGTDTISNFQDVIGSDHGDTITTSTGANNVITCGAGDDLVIVAGSGYNIYDGGGGSNTLSYELDPGWVYVDLSSGTVSNGFGGTDVFSNFQNVIGSAYDDVIFGDSNNNVISGGAGNNNLDGGGGTNTLDYSHDPASVTVDLADGWALNGYGGTDTIANFQNVLGSNYGDTIYGSSDNVITCGSGDDLVVNGGGSNTYDGGGGTNTLSYENDPAGVTVDLSTGTATNGSSGTDTISNFQNVIGSAHDDTITGDSHNNIISGGGGDNVLDGGGGINTLDYSHDTAGVTVDLSTGTATNGSSGTDTVSNFQNVVGSAFDDVITGDSHDNVISGGAGYNTLDGGGGVNTLDYSHDPGGITADLTTGTVYNGYGYADTVSNFQIVMSSHYDDTITGDGTTTVSYANATGAVTVDLSAGTATGDGSDTLSGITGVIGSSYGDSITCDDNNDTVYGNGGSDNIYCGAGADTILLKDATAFTGVDTIHGFSTSNGDIIDIANVISGYDPLTDAIANFVELTTSGSNTQVKVDTDGSGTSYTQIATIAGVTGLDLSTLVSDGNLVVHHT